MNNSATATALHSVLSKFVNNRKKINKHNDIYLDLEYRNVIPHPSKRSDR